MNPLSINNWIIRTKPVLRSWLLVQHGGYLVKKTFYMNKKVWTSPEKICSFPCWVYQFSFEVDPPAIPVNFIMIPPGWVQSVFTTDKKPVAWLLSLLVKDGGYLVRETFLLYIKKFNLFSKVIAALYFRSWEQPELTEWAKFKQYKASLVGLTGEAY